MNPPAMAEASRPLIQMPTFSFRSFPPDAELKEAVAG
jgi:hypothetical protein